MVFRGRGKCSRGTVEREETLLYWQGEMSEDILEPALLPPISTPLLLFIAEAPELADEGTGVLLSGPAGRIFNLCLSYTRTPFRFYITSLISCHPWKWDRFHRFTLQRTPTPEEIGACAPKLKQISSLHSFDGVIGLGNNISEHFVTNLTVPSPFSILNQEYKLHDIKSFALKVDRYVNSLGKSNL